MTLATCGEESNDCWYMEIADRPMAGSRPLFLPGVRLHMQRQVTSLQPQHEQEACQEVYMMASLLPAAQRRHPAHTRRNMSGWTVDAGETGRCVASVGRRRGSSRYTTCVSRHYTPRQGTRGLLLSGACASALSSDAASGVHSQVGM